MTAGQKMKKLLDEIARVDSEIARLQGVRDGLVRAQALLTGGDLPPEAAEPRKRVANVKPMILDIMKGAGSAGATSTEVSAAIRRVAPTVGKDTVGSVLSRLKSDGALVYDGERYFDKAFGPKADVRHFGPRAVS